MTLQQWLNGRDIDYRRGMCVSLATDGFKVGRDHVVGINLVKGAPGSPINTVMVAGADINKVSEIIGVAPTAYYEEAVGMPRAQELVNEMVKDVDFLVTYRYTKFAAPWLLGFGEPFSALPVLDIILVIKLIEHDFDFPSDIEDVIGLQERLEASLFHVADKPYGMDAVAERYLGPFAQDFRDEPGMMKRIKQLCLLWQVAQGLQT